MDSKGVFHEMNYKVIILLFVVILAAVAITAQVMPEEITEGVASAINDLRIKLVGRFDHLEYTILKSTKEKPVIYARDDIVRDRIVLNYAQGVVQEFLPLPNGICEVTIASGPRIGTNGPAGLELMEARNADVSRNLKNCGETFVCSHTLNVSDEYPMLRISVRGGDVVTHMSVSYQCTRS